MTFSQKLIDENHAFLKELGVSHESLEIVKAKTASYNLRTKLTGAGGGGCAVTLVPDGTRTKIDARTHPTERNIFIDFSNDSLESLIGDLTRDGFEAYLTSVGGSGLGVLSPYNSASSRDTALTTPPETPDDHSDDPHVDDTEEPIRSAFENKSREEFAEWAEARGRWLFV